MVVWLVVDSSWIVLVGSFRLISVVCNIVIRVLLDFVVDELLCSNVVLFDLSVSLKVFMVILGWFL